MKITIKTASQKKYPSFADLQIGDTFSSNQGSTFWIKTYEVYVSSTRRARIPFNAVSLKDGIHSFFDPGSHAVKIDIVAEAEEVS